MRLVGIPRLKKFVTSHADARPAVAAWIAEAEDAEWQSPADIKARYPSASILSGNRVIFNIKGNKYRIEVKVNYETQVVLAVQIGTHAEYMKWML
jgi:mRNA interferase HigB